MKAALHQRFKRIQQATKYSIMGLRAAWKHEKAIQDECILFIPIFLLGLALGETGIEKALLIGSWLIVIIAELLNSAVEAITDRVSTEHHELSGRAKDLGSAAVFVALCLAAFVWFCILIL